MTQREQLKANLRVEFTKAIITGALGDKQSPYINYVEPESMMAKQAWELGNALAEMEMEHRKEQSDGSKDPKA